MLAALLVFASLTSAPSAEALRLGRSLAEHGMLASLLPLMKTKETEELLVEDPHLTPAEQIELRKTADRVFASGYERLMQATAEAYARELSVSDLRVLARFYASKVAARYRSATPLVIMSTMKAVGSMDFKGDVRTAFCAQTHHLCPK